MSLPAIAPVAKSLYLCDGHLGFSNQKTDLIGLFNAIRPAYYPHGQPQFVIFAQLIGGQGQVPFYIDIRYAPDGTLVHTTNARLLNFPHRAKMFRWLIRFKGAFSHRQGFIW